MTVFLREKCHIHKSVPPITPVETPLRSRTWMGCMPGVKAARQAPLDEKQSWLYFCLSPSSPLLLCGSEADSNSN
ncbi:hypothetical protein CEXT_334851 [Caerostris extrusa]|uniref:Uncharacterized protein n=1 Tax=Caerostris extrusa TaxID=172846 RepID=A0AAV4UZ35_CAEEX|nr:hypothetical protein CEXT_334851 [Caerostris extrusa]